MRNYTYDKTSNPKLFRVVDQKGDWTHYIHFSKKNKKGDKTFLRSVNFVLSQGYAKPRLNEWLKNHTAEEAERILSERGERGDKVHQAIYIFLRDGRISRDTQVLAEDNRTLTNMTPDEFECVLAFVEFWNRHECRLIVQDYAVFNLKLGYAGTLDAIVKIGKACEAKICREKCKEIIDKPVLWDWKSSGAIYDEHGAQVAAYASCDNVPAIAHTAILRVGTNHKTTGGYEVEVYDSKQTAKHLQEFFSAMTIHNASYKEFLEDKIVEIPNEAKSWDNKKTKKRKKK